AASPGSPAPRPTWRSASTPRATSRPPFRSAPTELAAGAVDLGCYNPSPSRRRFGAPPVHFELGDTSLGLSHQEAPQEDAQAQAQEDAQEDEVAAPRQVALQASGR